MAGTRNFCLICVIVSFPWTKWPLWLHAAFTSSYLRASARTFQYAKLKHNGYFWLTLRGHRDPFLYTNFARHGVLHVCTSHLTLFGLRLRDYCSPYVRPFHRGFRFESAMRGFSPHVGCGLPGSVPFSSKFNALLSAPDCNIVFSQESGLNYHFCCEVFGSQILDNVVSVA